MYYHVEFEACALIFLIVLTVRFFTMHRFPNAQNKLFGIVLWCAIADLTLDIVGSFTIEYSAFFPIWVNYLINTVFYLLQVVFSALMALYVIILRDGSLRLTKSILLLSIPAAIAEALLIINLFTGIIFYIPVVDGSQVYTRGPLFNHLYFCTAFYAAAALIIAFRSRASLQKKQLNAIIAFILTILAAVCIQFILPSYLLTGVALTVAILMTFFVLQNPEDLLDLISGVFNYSAMMDFLNIRISEGKQLWLVAADVGGIRRVNSAFGVSVGNDVFAEIGKFFDSLEGNIWPFRMIGTRFLLVASNSDEYRRIIDEIEERFQEPWHVRDTGITLSVTIRYFGEWDFFKSPEDVVNLIDVAYSEIGAEGWGVKKRISTELLLQTKRNLTIESAIREALKTGSGFSLCFQPIYNPRSRQFSHAEALLRLDSPELGHIPPSEFIPVAERTGLILQIDEVVLHKVCDFYVRNERDLRSILNCIDINLSAAEFFKNPCVRIHSIVLEHRISPGFICFEVTETAATSHPGILSGFMRDMISRGYHFALDDFGTGYANISRVIELPFDTVKLDRALLLPEDEKSRILFASVLQMLSKIGITTIVEGVETQEQSELALLLGADMIQGYHHARPMIENEFVSFMRNQVAEEYRN